MSEINNVRIILEKCKTSCHGELLSKEHRTVDILSDEIEKLLIKNNLKGFSVIGAELIDPESSEKKLKLDGYDIDF